jgi:hypothetical protein
MVGSNVLLSGDVEDSLSSLLSESNCVVGDDEGVVVVVVVGSGVGVVV